MVPSLDQLASRARGEDDAKATHAALQLAIRDGDGTFLEFLTRHVPAGEVTVEIFERFAAAHELAALERQYAKESA